MIYLALAIPFLITFTILYFLDGPLTRKISSDFFTGLIEVAVAFIILAAFVMAALNMVL